MPEPTLTLMPMKCRHEGCGEKSTTFGFCKLHEGPAISRRFAALVEAGMCSPIAPSCFESQAAWEAYAVAFELANQNNKGGRYEVEFCRDCTPGHRQRMLEAGRCEHPETVFVKSDRFNDVIGVAMLDRKRSEPWERAMMGMSGQVVAMPPSEVVNQVINELAASRKGRGRPRKVSII